MTLQVMSLAAGAVATHGVQPLVVHVFPASHLVPVPSHVPHPFVGGIGALHVTFAADGQTGGIGV